MLRAIHLKAKIKIFLSEEDEFYILSHFMQLGPKLNNQPLLQSRLMRWIELFSVMITKKHRNCHTYL